MIAVAFILGLAFGGFGEWLSVYLYGPNGRRT